MDVLSAGTKKSSCCREVAIGRGVTVECAIWLCLFNKISTDTNQDNTPQISTTVGSHIFHCLSPSLPVTLTLLEQLMKMLKVFPQGPLG